MTILFPSSSVPLLERVHSPRGQSALVYRRLGSVQRDHLQLLGLLLTRHCNPYDSDADRPFEQHDIEQILGWDQSRVSRRMKLIFPHGMRQYYQAYAVEPATGYAKASIDRSVEVDGVVDSRLNPESLDHDLEFDETVIRPLKIPHNPIGPAPTGHTAA